MDLSFLHITTLIRIIILIGIGIPGALLLKRKLRHVLNQYLHRQYSNLISSTLFYIILTLILIAVLHDFGFQLSGFLGTAGVLGLIIGFAAQTSISNVISGIFIFLDESFKIGDVITVAGLIGTIESLDLFSIKLRTSDNKLIRLSNSYLLTNVVMNGSYFSTVRIDIQVIVPNTVAHEELFSMINTVLQHQKDILKDPKPILQFSSLHSGNQIFIIQVWSAVDLMNAVTDAIIAQLNKLAEQKKMLMAASRIN